MPIRFTRRLLLEAAAVGTAQASGLAAEQNRSFADAGHVRGSVRPYEVVVADVDTTGLDPMEDRIVTVALLKADLGDSSAEEGLLNAQCLHVKVDPGVPISAGASNVHGIYDDDVRGRKRFSEVAPNIRNFIGDLPLIGHNVEFDRTFLSSELRRAGGAIAGAARRKAREQIAGGGASDEALADNRRIAAGAEAGGNRGDGADPLGR